MRTYVAGHRGMVGAAIVRELVASHEVVVPHEDDGRGPDLRMTDQSRVIFSHTNPEAVVLCAGRVGGIGANRSMPVEFLQDNVLIGMNVLAGAHAAGVQRLVNLGSSCIYPRDCPQPMRPEHLLTGPLEPTNEGYALAKIATLRLAQYYQREYGRNYVSVMPTNLYGTGDHYDEQKSHAMPALIMKFENARRRGGPVRLWGTGKALREFLHVADLAAAVRVVLERYHDEDPVNIGSGEEISIADLALLVARATGYDGPVQFDSSMPDGTPRKLLDSSVIRSMGWTPRIGLVEGIERTIEEYRRLP